MLVRKPAALALLTIALSAAALPAGTVYVAMPGITAAGSQTFETRIVLSNELTSSRNLEALFLAAGSDGTARGGLSPITLIVPAKGTAVLSASGAGLYELDGPRDFRYSGRLVGLGTTDGLGTALPVIGSENLSPAGVPLLVHGLRSNVANSLATTLGVVNLGHQAASCKIDLLRANGSAFIPAATVALQPLSSRLFPVGAGVDSIDVRAKVSCDRAFYAYATTTDEVSGDVAVLWPATGGDSSLATPGALPECDAAATCFEIAGFVHRPSVANPVGKVSFPAPAVDAKRLRLTLDVTVDQWFAGDPDGKHLVYYFIINKNIDMPGMLYFRGPDAYTALVRHGIGLKHPQKKRLVDENFSAQVGRTYRVVNDYDMGGNRYEVTITDVETGEVASRITGSPNVSHRQLKAGDNLIVHMGFPEGVIPDEVPSYNWSFDNLRVEVFP